MATYKAVMRPALEYASSIGGPLASSTGIDQLHIYIYHSNILSTMISFWTLRMPYYFNVFFVYIFNNFVSTLCIYDMYLMSLTDSFDDRSYDCEASLSLISIISC